jgi:glycogen debranching enzyme
MARIGEVPFRRYYGSVDATPLFLVLAAAYFERTGDSALIRFIWRNIQLALDWIDNFGDRDGDGFVEYARLSSNGLVQQGWKDSHDSVFHADGRLAEGPIALCEVQAYVYAAKRGIGAVAAALGYHEQGKELEREAEALRTRFHEAFWCEEMSLYALASIKKSANAKCAALMQANVSFLELPAPNTPTELQRGSCPVHSSPGGESAQSLVQKSVTIRCPITTGPSGHTIAR